MTAKSSKTSSPSYRVLVGLNFPGSPGKPERRVEKDAVVDDMPQWVAESLLEEGAIEPVKGGGK